LSQAAADYQMLVHLFGANSSPAYASYALRKVADDNATQASSETVLTVKKNFYVDGCLKSVKGVGEGRPVATSGHSGAVPSPNFGVVRKMCFKHIIKAKTLPPPNLRTWLRTRVKVHN